MQRIILFLVCLLMISGCAGPKEEVVSTISEKIRQSTDFHQKIVLFQQLVDKTLKWRTEALLFYRYIEEKNLYSNHDIILLHEQGTERYRQIRQPLLDILHTVEWAADDNVEVVFVENQPTTIVTSKPDPRMFSEEEKVPEKQIVVHLNPRDVKGQRYIKEAKLSLASALLLYDNYLMVISHFQEIKKTRKLLNYDNAQVRKYLDSVAANYLNLDNYQRTARALALFEKELQWEKRTHLSLDEDNEYLNLLVQGSYIYGQMSKHEGLGLVPGNIELYTVRLKDTVENVSDSLTFMLVRSFSSVIGLIETRKGKLTALSSQERQIISNHLKPLDILLEKTPFRLTDKTIPGYWGHVAIWIGGQKDLEQLGIWNHPLVQQYHQEIEEKKSVLIEALLPGVEINSLDHFLNIDDLGVLRPVSMSMDDRRDAVLRAFAQVGKEYDYNFNVETDRRIVCSELAYVVFNAYTWETEKIFGRATISPDNIVNFSLNTGLFKPELLYLNGNRFSGELVPKMKALQQQH
ncbi:YiiX/YebB-like N1pC/P60 family cysteine hydrolase [Desulfomarina sp.]